MLVSNKTQMTYFLMDISANLLIIHIKLQRHRKWKE